MALTTTEIIERLKEAGGERLIPLIEGKRMGDLSEAVSDFEPENNYEHACKYFVIVEDANYWKEIHDAMEKAERAERERKAKLPKIEFTFQKRVVFDQEEYMEVAESISTGSGYWCGYAEPVGECLGDYVFDNLALGGAVKLYPDDDEPVIVTAENFQKALIRALEENRIEYEYGEIPIIDSVAADVILQYAAFGEIVYG